MELKKVSVIVPVRNEEIYIEKFIESLLNQDYPQSHIEILLIDGLSEDRTSEIIKRYCDKYQFIKLYTNDKKTVQYALNIGILNSSGEYIVRMDAHATYHNDYISKCIECAEKTGANNVGGSVTAKGFNPIQKVIAAAYSSPFALGGGMHYKENFNGYADTVSWGCFKRDYLLNLGMYDERLPRSEDDDLNFRINKSGGKIYISSEIKSEYYPKENFRKLFKQYFNYGVWKIAVMKKHGRPLKFSQIIPMCFVAFLLVFGVLSVFSRTCFNLFLLGNLAYWGLSFYFSFRSQKVVSFKDKLLLMWAQFVIHFSYGMGFWVGIFKFLSTKW